MYLLHIQQKKNNNKIENERKTYENDEILFTSSCMYICMYNDAHRLHFLFNFSSYAPFNMLNLMKMKIIFVLPNTSYMLYLLFLLFYSYSFRRRLKKSTCECVCVCLHLFWIFHTKLRFNQENIHFLWQTITITVNNKWSALNSRL